MHAERSTASTQHLHQQQPQQQQQKECSATIQRASFTISAGELRRTPSRTDGLSEVQERHLRVYGCELIQEAGILLRLYVVVRVSS
jgi:hypothetical protein